MNGRRVTCAWIALFLTAEIGFSCPDDWFRHYGVCLQHFLSEDTYAGAMDACREANSELASPTVLNMLALYAASVQYQKPFWIKTPGWDNSSRAANGNCTFVEIVHISSSACEDRKGYICQMSSEGPPTGPTCPSNTIAFGDSCFGQTSQPVSQSEARAYCSRAGGHLADMSDRQTIVYAKMAALAHNETLWVGNTEQELDECMRMTPDDSNRDGVVQWATGNCTFLANALCELAPTKTGSTLPTTIAEEPRCPVEGSWKERPGTGFCYWETTYEMPRKSWDEARDFCRRYGGDLASYADEDEEVFALGSARGHHRGLWMGLRRYLTENDFRWSDGAPTGYFRWAPGEPKVSSSTKFCVAHSGSESSDWELSYCGIRRWFVCKAPKARNPPTQPPPVYTQATPNSCYTNDIGVWRAWELFSGRCYMVDEVSGYSWEMARLFCIDHGAHMVTVHSYAEIDFLLSLMHGDTDYWLGLRAKGLESPFEWIDGSDLDVVFWDEERDIRNREIDSCVAINNRSGYWYTTHCNHLFSVICEKDANASLSFPVPTPPVVLPGFCADEWYMFGNNCYKIFGYKVSETETWENAQAKCSRIGGNLASVHNQAEQEFLTELVVEIGFNAWIGLKAQIRGSLFHWTDNSTLDFTSWNVGEPYQNHMKEDCVEMMYSEDSMGKWNDVICTKPKAFICQRPKDPTLAKPGKDPRICSKPKGWSRLGSSCFKLFGGTENLETWLDAQSRCKKFNASLATIKSYGATLFLKRLIAAEKRDPLIAPIFWTGAREMEEGTYAWLSQIPFTYSNWLLGQPQEVSEHSNCVAVNFDGNWIVRDCKEKHAFVCEFRNDTAASSSATKINGTCPNATYWHNVPGNYCYSFSVSDMQTWNNAMHKCFQKGGFLASFHSREQLDYVATYVKSSPWPLHIGLGQRNDGTFSWVDGSAVDFVNWQEGEPNSLDELCVEMHSDVLTWNDIPCTEKRGYVCSVPKVFSNITASASKKEKERVEKILTVGGIVGIVVCVLVVLVILAVAAHYLCPSTKWRSRHHRFLHKLVNS